MFFLPFSVILKSISSSPMSFSLRRSTLAREDLLEVGAESFWAAEKAWDQLDRSEFGALDFGTRWILRRPGFF